MTFTKGQRVFVATPVGIMDRDFRGRKGSFVEYTKTHGYARVFLDNAGMQLLHPESLAPLGSREPSAVGRKE